VAGDAKLAKRDDVVNVHILAGLLCRLAASLALVPIALSDLDLRPGPRGSVIFFVAADEIVNLLPGKVLGLPFAVALAGAEDMLGAFKTTGSGHDLSTAVRALNFGFLEAWMIGTDKSCTPFAATFRTAPKAFRVQVTASPFDPLPAPDALDQLAVKIFASTSAGIDAVLVADHCSGDCFSVGFVEVPAFRCGYLVLGVGPHPYAVGD
jgi:hypothetical protein